MLTITSADYPKKLGKNITFLYFGCLTTLFVFIGWCCRGGRDGNSEGGLGGWGSWWLSDRRGASVRKGRCVRHLKENSRY